MISEIDLKVKTVIKLIKINSIIMSLLYDNIIIIKFIYQINNINAIISN